MRCSGCKRELEIGDQYIEDTASGFMKSDPDSEFDNIMAKIMGGSGNKIVYCDDCTEKGGDYKFETFYGDEE